MGSEMCIRDSAWGIKRDTKVILIVGRIVRRKGHHVVVKAAKRLKEMGFKDFLCVFVGEDRGRTHYTGELWDLVLATGAAMRMTSMVSVASTRSQSSPV